MLGLLTVAVAATMWGVGVATNTPPPATATFGTATAAISLPGTDPHLAAEIAQIGRNYGPIDVIENQVLSTGSTQSVELRAQNPAGRFGRPLLALDSGHYPAGPGQVALTSQVASLYDVKAGGTWHADGRSWLVTGIVENPADLNDEFALVAPGKVTTPTQVTILVNAPQGAGQNQDQVTAGPPPPVFAGLPADANVSLAGQSGHTGIISPATIVLVVAVLGLVFIGLVSVAGVHRDGPAAAAGAGHARRAGRDRAQRPAGDDGQRRRGRADRHGSRRGGGVRRLVRLRPVPGGRYRAPDRPAEPAVVGDRGGDGAGRGDLGARSPAARPCHGPGPGAGGPVRAPGRA